MKYSKEEIAEAKADLLKYLKEKDTLYTIHRTRKAISLVVFPEETPCYLTYKCAVVLGQKMKDSRGYNAIIVNYTASNTVQDIAYRLFGNENALRHDYL